MNAARPTLRFFADVARRGRLALSKEMSHFEQCLVSCWEMTLTVICSKE
jgi:hypothetical protein